MHAIVSGRESSKPNRLQMSRKDHVEITLNTESLESLESRFGATFEGLK